MVRKKTIMLRKAKEFPPRGWKIAIECLKPALVKCNFRTNGTVICVINLVCIFLFYSVRRTASHFKIVRAMNTVNYLLDSAKTLVFYISNCLEIIFYYACEMFLQYRFWFFFAYLLKPLRWLQQFVFYLS